MQNDGPWWSSVKTYATGKQLKTLVCSKVQKLKKISVRDANDMLCDNDILDFGLDVTECIGRYSNKQQAMVCKKQKFVDERGNSV